MNHHDNDDEPTQEEIDKEWDNLVRCALAVALIIISGLIALAIVSVAIIILHPFK